MRYTKKQKAAIAKYQGQRYGYRDMFGNVTKVVYLCRMCHREFANLDDLEVDHIIPVSARGPETLDNLQLLCTKDNRKKGSAIRVKGKLIRLRPRTAKKKSSISKKGSTTKGKSSTTKKKGSTPNRKATVAKKKTGTTKRKRPTVKRKASTAKRKRR